MAISGPNLTKANSGALATRPRTRPLLTQGTNVPSATLAPWHLSCLQTGFHKPSARRRPDGPGGVQPSVAARRDVDRKAATPTSCPTAQPPNRDDRIATNPFKDKLVKHTRKLNNDDWNGPSCPQGSAITIDQLRSCYSHTYKAKSEPKSEPVLVILLMSPEQDHC